MANHYVLIGRLVKINDDSIIIDTTPDKIMIKLSSSILENVKNHCNIGGVIGIRGRIGVVNDQIELTCEKCTFLSTTAPTEEC